MDKTDTIKKETESEQFEFHNNFDKVKSIDVYNHFKAGLVEGAI